MIGFAQIIGGKPSSVGGMTDHLMNKTLALGPEDERLALYYGRGQVRDDLFQELVDLLRRAPDELFGVECGGQVHAGEGVVAP